MHRLQSKMASRAPFLEPSSLMEVFKLLDKDGSGKLNGAEVQEMFNTMCGRPVEVSNGQDEYSLRQFRDSVERLDGQYPQFQIAVNLMKYLKENRADEPDPDPACAANCEKLFGVLDADGTGELELKELFNMFKFLGLQVEQLVETYTDHANISGPEELQQVLQEMSEKYPTVNIPEKVVEFLGDAAYAGGKPDTEGADGPPADPPAGGAGKKKALLVGINYRGHGSELGGCINDVVNQKAALMEHFEFAEEDIMMLTEDEDESNWPKKARIQEGFAWLLDGAEEGDELVFQYSGHGSQCADRTSEEPDGKNECICPLDCQEGPWPDYVILDNEIYTTFYENLPSGVKCICIFDCCHSGTVADLQCTRAISFEPEDQSRWLQPNEEEQAELQSKGEEKAEASRQVAERGSSDGSKTLWTFSGCQDNQTSADATLDGLRQGAFTWAFIKALVELGWKARYEDILQLVRKNLKDRFTQIPALSTTTDEHFRLWYLDKE